MSSDEKRGNLFIYLLTAEAASMLILCIETIHPIMKNILGIVTGDLKQYAWRSSVISGNGTSPDEYMVE